MSAALLFPFDTAREDLPRRKFTREDVERLTAYDFFERQRFELVNGDLIDKAGQKTPHSFAVQSFFEVLVQIFGFGYVRVGSDSACHATAATDLFRSSMRAIVYR